FSAHPATTAHFHTWNRPFDFALLYCEAAMSSIIRFLVGSVLIAIILLSTAAPAYAQFYGGGLRRPAMMPTYSPMGFGGFSTRNFYPIPPSYFGGLPPVQPVRPLPGVNTFNPLMFNPFNPNYSPQNSNAVTYYGLGRLYNQSGYSPSYFPSLSSGGYMTGGVQSLTYDPNSYYSR